MGKEEEIARIARRLDKMVTKKSAVRGAGRQDPGTPAPPRRARRAPVRAGEITRGAGREPCPGQPCPSPPHPRLGRHQAWTWSGSPRSALGPQLRPGTAPAPRPNSRPRGRPATPFLGPAPPGHSPPPWVPHPGRPARVRGARWAQPLRGRALTVASPEPGSSIDAAPLRPGPGQRSGERGMETPGRARLARELGVPGLPLCRPEPLRGGPGRWGSSSSAAGRPQAAPRRRRGCRPGSAASASGGPGSRPAAAPRVLALTVWGAVR